jgi:hypothetical protein
VTLSVTTAWCGTGHVVTLNGEVVGYEPTYHAAQSAAHDVLHLATSAERLAASSHASDRAVGECYASLIAQRKAMHPVPRNVAVSLYLAYLNARTAPAADVRALHEAYHCAAFFVANHAAQLGEVAASEAYLAAHA